MRKGARSDVGRRRAQNEDNFFTFNNRNLCYAIVADGMGGHQAGEIASSMAINEIRSFLASHVSRTTTAQELEELVRQAFVYANEAIFKHASTEFSIMGMGTTTTMALVCGKRLITANVGDSRTYRISNGKIKQLTVDHSYVNELVMMGQITPEQAKTHPKRNYITRAMGTEPAVGVDICSYEYSGEKILLCSDGLTNLVSDEEILETVQKHVNYNAAVKALIKLANDRGGTDNITVVLFDKRVI